MITERELEAQAITWFQDTGWEFRHGPYIAPDVDTPERVDYHQVLLTARLLDALRRLNRKSRNCFGGRAEEAAS